MKKIELKSYQIWRIILVALVVFWSGVGCLLL